MPRHVIAYMIIWSTDLIDYDVGKASICHRTSKMQHAASCMYVTDTDGCNIHQLYNKDLLSVKGPDLFSTQTKVN